MKLTKEQRNEFLFLVLEKLQTRPDYPHPDDRLTSELGDKLPRLIDSLHNGQAGELSLTASANASRATS